MTKTKNKLPDGFARKLTKLVRELEEDEDVAINRMEMGEIELRINVSDAMWYVAYKTAA